MNVTEEAIRAYITTFHETLEATAHQFLPEETRGSLLHTSLLPAKIIGFVSTQFGAGVEYVPTTSTTTETVRGFARVEDLFVRAPAAARATGPMIKFREGSGDYINLGGVFGLTLRGAFPFRLAGPKASARFGEVAFEIGHWRREVEYAEIFGNRAFDFWTKEQAVARAKDEVLAALAQTKRAEARQLSLPEYIAKFKERIVLLLGHYDEPGLGRLSVIATALSAKGYDPILIKDVPNQPAQDLSQKVATVGSLARFVIVDDTSKSGHLSEVQICRHHDWITVLLRQGGKGASWMTAGASITSNVILEQAFDENRIVESVARAVEWAEAKISELERKFNNLYPWRMSG